MLPVSTNDLHQVAMRDLPNIIDSLKQDRSNLQANLRFVRSVQADFGGRIAGASDEIRREESRLADVVKISKIKSANSVLRMKDGILKVGNGKMSNFLFHRRYKSERAEAARQMGCAGGKVSAKEAALIITENIGNLEKSISILRDKINELNLMEKSIKRDLDSKDTFIKHFSGIQISAIKKSTRTKL